MKAVSIRDHRGPQLENRFPRGPVVPELFRPFDPLADLFDQGLRQGTGDWESLLAISRVVHALAAVGEVRRDAMDDLAWVRVGDLLAHRQDAETRLPHAKIGDDLRHVSFPASRGPLQVLTPAGRRIGVDRLRGGIDVFHGMNEIRNGDKGVKPSPLDRPVARLTVAEERFLLRRKEAAGVGFRGHHRPELFAAGQRTDARVEQSLRLPGSSILRGRLCRRPAGRRGRLRFQFLLASLFFQVFQPLHELLHVSFVAKTVRQARPAGLPRRTGFSYDESPRFSSPASAAGERLALGPAHGCASARHRKRPPPNPAAHPPWSAVAAEVR